ncbi:MAG TPA: ligase-associated DNA damage response endonuclease PdeM, partial [Gemmatimonadaceae bacterium]|nr:ligase-associated DNA damage response endonuclease PdeM [Gemmatimonadaceae bacterium]
MILSDGDQEITIAGQRLLLLPERAVFWEAQSTVLIADPHFGKSATFRASGIPVPSGTTADAVERLKTIVGRTNAVRVIFLGDFLHAREGRSKQMLDELLAWRESCRGLGLLLVRGNHDRHAGDPPGELNVECVDGPYELAPFVLTHHPKSFEAGYSVAGHIHPAVRLSGRGRQHLRLPCYLFGETGAVLPAF